jgi:hypothetical protein
LKPLVDRGGIRAHRRGWPATCWGRDQCGLGCLERLRRRLEHEGRERKGARSKHPLRFSGKYVGTV